MKTFLIFLCLGLIPSLTVASKHGHHGQGSCSRPDVDPDAHCELDLTFVLDFSISMKNKENIYQVANYTLNSIVPRFDISRSKVNIAFQAMGTWHPFNSPYFTRFKDLCKFIQHAERNLEIFGSRFAQLQSVFSTYLAHNTLPVFNRPKVKHVLVIVTAVNDAFNIDLAIPISHLVRKKAKVVIVGINQTNKDRLPRIADVVDFVDFGNYGQQQSDFIVKESCGKNSNQSTTQAPTEGPTVKPTTGKPAIPSTDVPTEAPTEEPATEKPTEGPATQVPTEGPTVKPTTEKPSIPSTEIPTEAPTEEPATESPTEGPATQAPTEGPTVGSTTGKPAIPSTEIPTEAPTEEPATQIPTEGPTVESTTKEPATSPTNVPTRAPTEGPITDNPTRPTTEKPIIPSTDVPTEEPATESPTEGPVTENPTENPTEEPMTSPTGIPTERPATEKPTEGPATENPPTERPVTENPTVKPTTEKPIIPSTGIPTEEPVTENPTGNSTEESTTEEPITENPTENPATKPTTENPLTDNPTGVPSEGPTFHPSTESPATENSSTASPEEPTNGSTEKPITSEPSTVVPVTGNPPTEAPIKPSTGNPEEPSTTSKSPDSESSTLKPVTENPSTEKPQELPTTEVSEGPSPAVTEEVSTEAPQQPTTKPPATSEPDQPATGAPSAEPLTNLPSTEQPIETTHAANNPNPTRNPPSSSTNAPVEVTTTSLPKNNDTNPLSNALGSQCSRDVSSAWLDVVFVIDTSAVVRTIDLNRLGGTIAGFFMKFNINQDEEQSTRVGIVTYSDNALERDGLDKFKDWNALYSEFINIGKYRNDQESPVDIGKALKAGQKLLENQQSHRLPVIVIVGASSNSEYVSAEAVKAANEVKGSGIKIASLTFKTDSSASTVPLSELASKPSYGLVSTDPNLYDKLSDILAEANCVCPLLTYQFSSEEEIFGDCAQGFHGQTPPSIAKLMCELSNGILVPVTTQKKLDFLTEEVVPFEIGTTDSFTIGLHHLPGADPENWIWEYYNDTSIPLGNFKNWKNDQPEITDESCASASKVSDSWVFAPNSCDYTSAKPYICQTKACDSSHLCDLEVGIRAAQKHQKLLNILKTGRNINIDVNSL